MHSSLKLNANIASRALASTALFCLRPTKRRSFMNTKSIGSILSYVPHGSRQKILIQPFFVDITVPASTEQHPSPDFAMDPAWFWRAFRLVFHIMQPLANRLER